MEFYWVERLKKGRKGDLFLDSSMWQVCRTMRHRMIPTFTTAHHPHGKCDSRESCESSESNEKPTKVIKGWQKSKTRLLLMLAGLSFAVVCPDCQHWWQFWALPGWHMMIVTGFIHTLCRNLNQTKLLLILLFLVVECVSLPHSLEMLGFELLQDSTGSGGWWCSSKRPKDANTNGYHTQIATKLIFSFHDTREGKGE